MKYDRRNKISFLQPSGTQNEYGEVVEGWTPFKDGIWASKLPLLGNEYFAAEQVQSKVEVKFECQYMAGVTNAMRIRDSEGDYEVLSAINVKGLNRDLLCYCKKVT